MGKTKVNRKDLVVKSRVPVALKRQVESYAREIGECESFVVRDAVREYLRIRRNGPSRRG